MYATSNHALQAEASPMHANSPTRIPVHLRCTQYNQRREPTRYARSHVITQCHHGMHAMHSRTHTRACPCISDAHRCKPNAKRLDTYAITQSRNHASNDLLVRNTPMISPMNLATERIAARSDAIYTQSRNAHDAHGISSHTRARPSSLHAEPSLTANQTDTDTIDLSRPNKLYARCTEPT